ncbi:class I SAM-dependent methyltransferase [Hoeflea alexandrii]|uniref:class I SAM-dependent methyltransferase n=1 Tax=Hoeflea alexandrii TaxID=288436 RepID=UPI0022AED449|nr:class I SAM-dependent methyltransferase [Hoeflea alexandrii]MCZ4288416.1 class I SAM-dependent methyltransferase [Hoeflea alexandrii]
MTTNQDVPVRADDRIEQRMLEAYGQNSENFRALNQLMWQIPLLAMTLTGGLWFGVSMADSAPLFQFCLLGLAAAGNFGLCLVLTRLRYIMECHLIWLRNFEPSVFVGAPGDGWFTKPFLVRRTFQIMLVLAALASVILMAITAKQAGWIGNGISGASVEFYNQQAQNLADLYEVVPFEAAHPALVDGLKGKSPLSVLDVGAGTGRDASWIAEQGHVVIAAEPSESFRRIAQKIHVNPRVIWIDDRLPGLKAIKAERFDWIVVSAVWMHIHPADRPAALARLKSLLTVSGKVYLTLRLGPADPDRAMFNVSLDELRTIALPLGLQVEEKGVRDDLLDRPEIKWMSVILRRIET